MNDKFKDKHIGYGIAWAGFWIMIGMISFGRGCKENFEPFPVQKSMNENRNTP